MADKEYIERGALLKKIFPYGDIVDPKCYTINAKMIQKEIQAAPTADVVSKGVYEQVQWERDMAMQQLEEHGIPFGGTADNVVEKMDGERKDIP